MQIHQIAHRAGDSRFEPEVRQMYWEAWRALSRTEQDLRLYQSAQENYRKGLQGNLSEEGRERLQGEYARTCQYVWELRWRKVLLEAFAPCYFHFEPVEDVIDERLLLTGSSQRLSQEEKKLRMADELDQALEQFSKGQISFDEAKPVIERYMDSSRN